MTILYADTSALLKRVIIEPASANLRRVLLERTASGDVVAASSLVWLEVWRSLRRLRVDDPDLTAGTALVGVDEIPLTDDILHRARRIGPDMLRSLDAIHLTSAVAVGASAVLTYDNRLADAAAVSGFEVLSPRPK